MNKPALMYTLIDLGDGFYDLMPQPTRMRFASAEQAHLFIKNLAKAAAKSNLTEVSRE